MPYTNKVNADGLNKPFSSRLRGLMEELKCTQKELGEALGVTYQAIGAYRDGKALPGLEVAQKIADYFNVSLDYLSGKTDIRSRNTGVQAIREATSLIESAAESLVSMKSAYAITLLNDLLLCPSEMVDELGKRYILYLHVKNYVIPQARALGAEETDFLPDIRVGGIPLPKVPLKDLEEYTRFEFYRAVVNFAEYKKEC